MYSTPHAQHTTIGSNGNASPADHQNSSFDAESGEGPGQVLAARQTSGATGGEAEFRAIFENAAIGIYQLDHEGRIVCANPAFTRLIGYPTEALFEKTIFDIAHPDDLEETQRGAQRLLERRAGHEVTEKRYLRADGGSVWVRVSSSFIEDPAGKRGHVLRVVEDISEKRLGETARDHLAALVDSTSDAIYSTDTSGRITSWNNGARMLYGYEMAEILGQPVSLLFPPDRMEELERIHKAAYQGERYSCWQSERRRKDGTLVPVSSSVSPIRDAQGRIVGVSGVVRDVSDRVEAARALQRYRLLAESASEIMVFADASGHVLTANRAAAQFRGVSAEALEGQDLREMIVPEDRGNIPRGEGLCGYAKFEVSAFRYDGQVVPLEITFQAMESEGERIYLCIGRDISERRENELLLARQAFYDALTDLPNRSLFMDRLQHALTRSVRSQTPLAVLFLDLDRFKVLNDSRGHHAGDMLLISVARRLQSCLRNEDTLARFGGDEFTVLLEGIGDEGQAARLADRLLRRLEEPFEINGHRVYTSASIGIAIGTAPNVTAEELVRNADLAMYRAKEEGKARYSVYHPHLGFLAEEQLRFETELRSAIEMNEFQVHFQPVILMETRQTISMEALARWEHPRFGLMPPDEFVPLQEQIGLIEPFTLWVLRESLAACQAWHDAGYRLSVSVNLSPMNLHTPGFVDRVAELTRQMNFPPSYLKLEITESAVMLDPAVALRVLNQFSDMGIRLSLDDFGTGYSSLSYLRQLPVQEIKIDKSFIFGMVEHDDDDAVIVRATIEMAHNLRKKVVAEGVEQQDVWNLLNILGCDAAQGYHMAYPMPPAEALEWLRTSPYGAAPRP